MMKSLLYIACAVIISSATSCDMPYFDRIPGKQIDNIPKELQGNYTTFEINIEEGKEVIKDTSRFTVKARSWTEIDDNNKETFLSDSIMFSSYGEYYFLSFLEPEGWNTMVIRSTNNGFTLGPLLIVEDDKDGKKLRKYFSSVEKLKNKSGDDYFYIKMNEDELIKYYESYISKNYYYRFNYEK